MDYSKLDKIKVKINNKEYELLVAKSEEEKEEGLMNVSEIPEKCDGMYFCYKDDPQEEIIFWMKNTNIPLDIIFVSDDMEVIDVQEGFPLSEDLLTCNAPEDSKIIAVIELNKDSGVKKGDDIEIDGEPFEFPENGMFLLNSDGSIQFELEGGERIMSRIFSRKLIHLCKKARKLKTDQAYKAVGRAIFKELTAQDNREPQYVEK